MPTDRVVWSASPPWGSGTTPCASSVEREGSIRPPHRRPAFILYQVVEELLWFRPGRFCHTAAESVCPRDSHAFVKDVLVFTCGVYLALLTT